MVEMNLNGPLYWNKMKFLFYWFQPELTAFVYYRQNYQFTALKISSTPMPTHMDPPESCKVLAWDKGMSSHFPTGTVEYRTFTSIAQFW